MACLLACGLGPGGRKGGEKEGEKEEPILFFQEDVGRWEEGERVDLALG